MYTVTDVDGDPPVKSPLVQPVPWKLRLEMVIGMQNEILIGIMKLLFYATFHLKIEKGT